MTTQIVRRLIRAVSILAVLVLCSCISIYTPNQSSIQKMSVEEARNIVLELAKPPTLFISNDTGDWTTIPKEDVYKVHLRTTSIKIVGKKRYDIPFKDLKPLVLHNGTTIGFTIVYLKNAGTKEGIGFAADGTTHSSLLDRDDQAAQRLADALNVLKIAALKFPEGEEALFQEAVRNYRASAPKPQLPEAARRFRVQAEGAIHDKDFDAAADYYEQGLGIAPWWPQGHFDLALVLSETGDFATAIFEMKRYLVLVPDAPDARLAQDKIYDWERKMQL